MIWIYDEKNLKSHSSSSSINFFQFLLSFTKIEYNIFLLTSPSMLWNDNPLDDKRAEKVEQVEKWWDDGAGLER